jgi:hypothetical protein
MSVRGRLRRLEKVEDGVSVRQVNELMRRLRRHGLDPAVSTAADLF